MFYCEDCAKIKGWPLASFISLGLCEVCGQHKKCFDIPSSLLPRPKVKQEDKKTN